MWCHKAVISVLVSLRQECSWISGQLAIRVRVTGEEKGREEKEDERQGEGRGEKEKGRVGEELVEDGKQ